MINLLKHLLITDDETRNVLKVHKKFAKVLALCFYKEMMFRLMS